MSYLRTVEGSGGAGAWLWRKAFGGGTGLFDGEEEISHGFGGALDFHIHPSLGAPSDGGFRTVDDSNRRPAHEDPYQTLSMPSSGGGQEKIEVGRIETEHSVIGQFPELPENAEHLLCEEPIAWVDMLGCGEILPPRASLIFIFPMNQLHCWGLSF